MFIPSDAFLDGVDTLLKSMGTKLNFISGVALQYPIIILTAGPRTRPPVMVIIIGYVLRISKRK